MRTRLLLLAGAAVALGAAAIIGSGSGSAADHGDAPLTKNNNAEDIADIYAFEGDSGNTVFVMTVAGLAMPGATPTFGADSNYQFRIDNDGDAVPDVTYNVTFGAKDSSNKQDVTLQRATGAAADSLSAGGDTVVTGETTPGTDSPIVNEDNGVKLFAGLRDDPFFFDLNAFKAGLAFRNPGNDFFKGLNVLAIVIEVPSDDFLEGSATTAGVWGITSRDGAVIDRMGRPAINTVFIPEASKDAFNNTKPADDVATWKSTVVATLNSLGSDPALADALLPDILTFDTSKPMNFLNGRALTDDVIDGELQLVTGNSAASDNVSNDSTFLAGFPYVGRPNTNPAPTPIAAPTKAAAAPAPASTPPTGITVPNTGTGDGPDTDVNANIWLIAAVIAAAMVVGGGALVVRSRGNS